MTAAPPGRDVLARALSYPYRRLDHPIWCDPCGGGYRSVRIESLEPGEMAIIGGYRRPVRLFTVEIESGLRRERLTERAAAIAAGSNAAPEQLARKWCDRTGAPPIVVAPAAVPGLASVYSAHVTSYGAIPATVHPVANAASKLHLIFVAAGEMALLDGSESLGRNYLLAALDGFEAVTDAGPVAGPLAYISRRGALLVDGAAVALAECAADASASRCFTQREMLDRVRRLVGDGRPHEEFVMALAGDAGFRERVTARLAGMAKRWFVPPSMILAGD